MKKISNDLKEMYWEAKCAQLQCYPEKAENYFAMKLDHWLRDVYRQDKTESELAEEINIINKNLISFLIYQNDDIAPERLYGDVDLEFCEICCGFIDNEIYINNSKTLCFGCWKNETDRQN